MIFKKLPCTHINEFKIEPLMRHELSFCAEKYLDFQHDSDFEKCHLITLILHWIVLIN